MVLAHFLREKISKRNERLLEEALTRGRNEGLAEGEATGRAAGRAAANAEWAAWNRRRADAEAAGIIFNEPPPADNDAC